MQGVIYFVIRSYSLTQIQFSIHLNKQIFISTLLVLSVVEFIKHNYICHTWLSAEVFSVHDFIEPMSLKHSFSFLCHFSSHFILFYFFRRLSSPKRSQEHENQKSIYRSVNPREIHTIRHFGAQTNIMCNPNTQLM